MAYEAKMVALFRARVLEDREDPRRGALRAANELTEMVAAGDVDFRRVDLAKVLFESVGASDYYACKADGPAGSRFYELLARGQHLLEGEGAVTMAAFQNITGQIVYATTLDAYNLEANNFTPLIPERAVSPGCLQGEKIAGITAIGDRALIRPEGQAYTLAGVGEDWVFTPPVPDRGLEIPVTWEAMFGDRTGQLPDRCGQVGKWIGVNVEKRAIDCVIDENSTAHRYNWRNAGQIKTYDDNTGAHTWDNLQASNGLVDWNQLNTAEQLSNQILDPFTGEPAPFELKHLVVAKQLEQTAYRVIHGQQIRVATPGYATTGNPTQTVVDNPYKSKYQIVTSKYLYPRMTVPTSWYLANIALMARRMVVQPLRTVQAPTDTADLYRRQIVAEFFGNERSAFVVVQPRAAIKSTVA